MTLPKSITDYAFSMAQARMDYWERYVDRYHPGESPIERLFLIAFLLKASDGEGAIFGEPPSPNMTEWFFILPQEPILSYRADFVFGLVEYPNSQRVVVECDGHDFHERTKEQASRDRKRDREMQSKGFKVFRFTGSEIYRNAMGCVDEVIDELYGIHYRSGE